MDEKQTASRPASGSTRTAQRLRSSSTKPSVYSLTFLAVAVLSLAQLRGVYQSSRGTAIFPSSPSLSSSALVSSAEAGGRQDPYHVAGLAHLNSVAATVSKSIDAGMSPASADAAGIPPSSADGTAKETNEENGDAISSSDANAAEVDVVQLHFDELPEPSADEQAARLRNGSSNAGSDQEGIKLGQADLMPDDKDDTAAAHIRSDGDANYGLDEPLDASGNVTEVSAERPSEDLSTDTTRGVLDTDQGLPPPPPPEPATERRQRPPLYSVARTDRAGATIRDMVLALAYGFARNRPYGGACYVQPMRDAERRQADKEALIRAIGLQDVLKFACPDSFDEPLLQQDDFFKYRFKMLTPQFMKWLRSKVDFPNPTSSGADGGGKPHAVVHVRRGDVDPCHEWAKRYLPNSYYQEVIRKYVPPDASVTIYSESFSFEPWDEFRKSPRYTLQLDTDLAEVWGAIMSAQYVVLSLSSFAYIPAVLNANATVLYLPTWQMVPMPHWTKVGVDIRRRSNHRTKKLAAAKCKKHKSLRPGTSLVQNVTASQG